MGPFKRFESVPGVKDLILQILCRATERRRFGVVPRLATTFVILLIGPTATFWQEGVLG
jgi:hypothetical protein